MRWAALILALGSCQADPGADGYEFGQRETDHQTVTVTKVEHASIGELRRAAATAGAQVEAGREIFAFGTITPARATCTIHFVRPENEWRPEALGHELAHCLYGRWHP